jgi:hemoglobin
MIIMQKNAAKPGVKEPILYERLGGAFAIAAVINRFSDEVVKNPQVGQRFKKPCPERMVDQEVG